MSDLAHRHAVARLLAQAAADVDRRGLPFAGIMRQGVRLLLEVPEASPGGCAGCARGLDQPRTGRHRKWCSEACRSRARRR